MKYKGYDKSSTRNYKRRKIILRAVTALLLTLLVIIVIIRAADTRRSPVSYVCSGICGAVNQPMVYRLPKGSNLSDLILMGKGLKSNADLRNINTLTTLEQDKIYHIPYRSEAPDSISPKRVIEYKLPVIPPKNKSLNFLYIGYPALYFIININTEDNEVNVTYIPHSTVFLDNEYRIMDIFFTLGIGSTVNILQTSLGTMINHYYIQDRLSFIKMIDNLGGIELDIDKWFAEEYNIIPGKQTADGFTAYEYIRFIGEHTLKSANKEKDVEIANELRQARQKEVIRSLYKSFIKAKTNDKILAVIQNLISNKTETSIDMRTAGKLLKDIEGINSLNFNTIPGYYKNINNNLYYMPKNLTFKNLRKDEKRKILNLIEGENKQI